MYITHITGKILTVLIAICMQFCVSNIVSTTPQEAAEDFLSGLSSQQEQIMEKHMDNSYINFMSNVQGDEKAVKRMQRALLKNFDYEIVNIGEKNDVAVAKVAIKNSDFTKVLDNYNKASYEYITDNMYSKDIGDKEFLNEKCFEIYVQQMEAASTSDKVTENVVFLPMIDNGHYGWNVSLSDDIMKSMLGGLEMPQE